MKQFVTITVALNGEQIVHEHDTEEARRKFADAQLEEGEADQVFLLRVEQRAYSERVTRFDGALA